MTPKVLKATQSLSSGRIKFLWNSPGNVPHPFQYELDPGDLAVRVPPCRTALDTLQRVADNPEPRALSKALQQVAASGRALYDALMGGEQASQFQEWFEDNVTTADAGTWRIEFVYPEGLEVIPWGLAYAQPRGAAAPRGTSFDDYIDFWANRYSTTTYSSSANSGFGVQQLDGNSFQCSLLLERAPDQVDVSYAARAGGDFEMKLRSHLGDHAISTVRDLRARFMDLSNWNHVIYLNLLTNAFVDEPLTPTALQQIAAFLGREAHAIAMIDREAIIRGDRGPDWLRVFFRDQWAGLIAVESDVTAKALRFHGFRFLTELLSREVPLAESLQEIRRALWPYSLLYGVYSNPDRVFVAPPPGIVDEMKAILREEGQAKP